MTIKVRITQQQSQTIPVKITSGGGGLLQVEHDDTLVGLGTANAPLGINPDYTKDLNDKIGTVADALADETTKREQSDTLLQEAIKSNIESIGNNTGAINALNTNLNAEITAREQGDTQINEKINAFPDYVLNPTVKQADAINSGINSDKVVAYDNHIANRNNPHNVTKTQVGLGNVDDTSDKNKPVSDAQAKAIAAVQSNLDDETTARTNADNGLQTKITKNTDDITDLRNDVDGLAKVATSGSYNDLSDKPTIGNAILTITRNNESAGNFTANATENKTINIAVPVSASDVNALPDSTKYGASFTLAMDSTTYKISASLKDQNGDVLGAVQTIDLPLESVVVSGAYDAATKEVVLTLEDGSEIRFSVADLVDGLQTEITETNKLSADLVDDSTSVNKFVTSAEKNTWNGKQDAISDLATIRAGASKGATAVQPADLAKVATSGSYNDLSNKPTIPAAQVNSDWDATSGVAQILNKPALGTAASKNATDFATAAQGALADTAVQPDALPQNQTGTEGQVYTKTADGAEWADATGGSSLPDQTGNAGKFLTTDGENASWSDKPLVNKSVSPTISLAIGNKYVSASTSGSIAIGGVTDMTSASGINAIAIGNASYANKIGAIQLGKGTNSTPNTLQVFDKQIIDAEGYIPSERLAVDGTTISANADGKLQASAVLNQRTSGVLKSWTGTLAQYNALATKSDDTQYIITDDDSAGTNVYTKAEVDSLVNSALATADYVIEFQTPTAANGYTWYRLYSDGWVEQGGIHSVGKLNDGAATSGTIAPHIQMADSAYYVNLIPTSPTNYNRLFANLGPRTKNEFYFGIRNIGGTTSDISVCWQVSGMAA